MLNMAKTGLPYSIVCADEFSWSEFDISNYHRVVVIAEEIVANLYASALHAALGRNIECITFPGGEANKTRSTKAQIEDQLSALACGRDTLIIALGGGITLDLVGFVAATYARGLPVVYCPTTLLAMVDATIGGKTGVNTLYGKNMIGCFYQPQFVMINLQTLHTLSPRDYLSGMAEVIKHALIADANFWSWLMEHQLALQTRNPDFVRVMVYRSLEIKAKIVAQDFKEMGERKILNFGHTFAHALEKILDYRVLHGEAVALGMIFAAQVSNLMGLLKQETLCKLQTGILSFGFDQHWLEGLNFTSLLAAMAYDKKNQQTMIHMSLVADLGQIYQCENRYTLPISEDILYMAFTQMMRLC